jgi:serine/threonine-protein kinase RsbW
LSPGSGQEGMAETRHLQVSGRYQNIPGITDFVNEAAIAAGLSGEEAFHCQLAVDEACTNIIEHAYGLEDMGCIEVACVIKPGVITVQIVDYGQPFDPGSVPEPVDTDELDQVEPGGIGLHLMRMLMDEVSFEFGDAHNTLTMVKRQAGASREMVTPDYIGLEQRRGVSVVTPQGRMDAALALVLEQVLLDLIEAGRSHLVVDMKDVTYISSPGLKTLVTAWRAAREHGGDLLLCSLVERVMGIFEMVGFTRVFRIVDDCAEAVGAFQKL